MFNTLELLYTLLYTLILTILLSILLLSKLLIVFWVIIEIYLTENKYIMNYLFINEFEKII